MIGSRIDVNIAGGLDVPLPKMVNVRQKFEAARLTDIPAARARVSAASSSRASSQAVIAVGCGSRA
jgi:hypothetical protein